MTEARYLVDTSVLARAAQERVGTRLEELVMTGKLWSCRVVDLEVVYASRAGVISDVIAERSALPEAPITPEVLDRALHVAGMLAAANAHRGAKPADLVIAAAAEAASLVVLHYDDGYDRISDLTGQPAEWIAAPGSLDG